MLPHPHLDFVTNLVYCVQQLMLNGNSVECYGDGDRRSPYTTRPPTSRERRQNLLNNILQLRILSRKPHKFVPKRPLPTLSKIRPIPRKQEPSLDQPQSRTNILFSRLDPLLLLSFDELVRVLNGSDLVLHTLRFFKKRNNFTQTRFEVAHGNNAILRCLGVEQDPSHGVSSGRQSSEAHLVSALRPRLGCVSADVDADEGDGWI